MTGTSHPLDELAALVQAQRGLLLEVLSADGPERAQASWRTALAALPELESRLRDYLTAYRTEPERRRATVLLAETRQRLRATALLVLTLARLGRAELAACTAAYSAGQTEPPTYAPAGPAGTARPSAVSVAHLLCQDA